MTNQELAERIRDDVNTAGDRIVDLVEALDAEGIPLSIICDQLLTYGGFVGVSLVGEAAAAGQFRDMAEKIAGGFYRTRGRGN